LLYNASNTFGAKGLYYSFYTILNQLGGRTVGDLNKIGDWQGLYDRDGFRSYYAIGHQTLLNVLGSRLPFAQEAGYVQKVWRPPPNGRYCFTRPGEPNTMDTFRDMVRGIRRSGVDVRFYLEPEHARMMLALQDAGLWPQFEDWKRGVIRVVTEEAEESGQPQIPVWDFSGFNTVTNEHLPDASDKSTMMRYFWEAAHYKKEAGDLILDRVLNYRDPHRVLPPDFGVRLTSANIESWLDATREAGRDYVRAETEEAAGVQDTVKRALEGSAGSNCGHYIAELQAASEAIRRGDRKAADAAFARAKAIDESDRRRAIALGVTYHEPGFAAALRSAEAGGDIPQ
jgi:hypothetical protein